MGKRISLTFKMAAVLLTFAASVYFTALGGTSSASFSYIEGVASWYSESSPGIKPTTANMEKFDHDMMTCAMWDVPFDTVLEVTNVNNGKKVTVRVNDRGPAKRFIRQGRVIDLTMGAFSKIESLDKGLTRVKIRIVKLPQQD